MKALAGTRCRSHGSSALQPETVRALIGAEMFGEGMGRRWPCQDIDVPAETLALPKRCDASQLMAVLVQAQGKLLIQAQLTERYCTSGVPLRRVS
jgi:hypothetical protein